MSNASTADALAKHIANLQKLNPKHLYMGALLDLIDIIDKYLAVHAPELRQQLNQYWPAIREQSQQLLGKEVPLV